MTVTSSTGFLSLTGLSEYAVMTPGDGAAREQAVRLDASGLRGPTALPSLA